LNGGKEVKNATMAMRWFFSKKLTEKKRDYLYEIIVEKAISWAVSISEPAEIDKINILQASLISMYRSSQNLSCPWDLILVDGNKTIPQLDRSKQKTVIKGDSQSASIAAASILAKVTRDRIMQEYHNKYPQYGFDSHKGYPTKAHFEIIRQIGITPIHRKSFCHSVLSENVLDLG